MDFILRIAAVSPDISVGNPTETAKSIAAELEKLAPTAPDIVLLPQAVLLPPSCGDLGKNPALLAHAHKELAQLAKSCQSLDALVFIGLPAQLGGRILPVTAALYHGEIRGYILSAKDSLELDDIPHPFLSADTVFQCGGGAVKLLACTATELPRYTALAEGADCLLLPSYHPATVGRYSRETAAAKSLSQALKKAIVCLNGGNADTSSPLCYSGYSLFAVDGEIVDGTDLYYPIASVVSDVDLQIASARRTPSLEGAFISLPAVQRGELLCNVSRRPYLPEESPQDYIVELFLLQCTALKARLKNTAIEKVILGVSGGLDSTLAMLVAASTMNMLGLPRSNIIAVTMPGFGTSERTHKSAIALPSKLGATVMEIPIAKTVLSHFDDIAHNPELRDITYENAQARERTQILLDLGNKYGAIVVGTGDLTEEALGWCTFGGDALAGYNLNNSVPKTLVREIVLAVANEVPELSEVLHAVLDTPISPELLPPDENGEIAQKTEEILGSYELHDFFLYYFIRHSFSPKKLLRYALAAFGDDYSEEQIRSQLELFLRRFITSQFKRSCAPDSAALTDWGLSAVEFTMPSDMGADSFLRSF